MAYMKVYKNEKDITEIEDNLKWLWRTISGAIILDILWAIVEFQDSVK